MNPGIDSGAKIVKKNKKEEIQKNQSKKEVTSTERLSKKYVAEAEAPQEAMSPKKAPARRIPWPKRQVKKCTACSWLGGFLWVGVGSFFSVGVSGSSVPCPPVCLSSCDLDALNYCPSGCTYLGLGVGPQVSDIVPRLACNGSFPDFHLDQSFTVTCLQQHVSYAGLPACEACGCSSNNSFLHFAFPADTPSEAFNASIFEFAFLVEALVFASHPKWGPHLGLFYLSFVFCIASCVILHGLVGCYLRIRKAQRGAPETKLLAPPRSHPRVKQSMRVKMVRLKRTRQLKRAMARARKRDQTTCEGSWLPSARKYGRSHGRHVRLKHARLASRIRARKLRFRRQFPHVSWHLVCQACASKQPADCMWLRCHVSDECSKHLLSSGHAAAQCIKQAPGCEPSQSGAQGQLEPSGATVPCLTGGVVDVGLRAPLLPSSQCHRRYWHGGGGGGGASTSKRQRQEEKILAGLQTLLASLDDDSDSENCEKPVSPGRPRGRSPTPRSLSPKPPSRSPSPGWQVKGKGRKGHEKGKGKDKGRGRSPDGARKVSFETPVGQPSPPAATSLEASMLAQLKALNVKPPVRMASSVRSRNSLALCRPRWLLLRLPLIEVRRLSWRGPRLSLLGRKLRQGPRETRQRPSEWTSNGGRAELAQWLPLLKS